MQFKPIIVTVGAVRYVQSQQQRDVTVKGSFGIIQFTIKGKNSVYIYERGLVFNGSFDNALKYLKQEHEKIIVETLKWVGE